MRILTIIPARKGSKRIVRKNVKELLGKPLISWTLDAAIAAGLSSSLIVSTDDPEVAHLAENKGLRMPWMRPPQLCTDTATTIDVCLHALNWFCDEFGEPDGVLVLQPTSPFRTMKTIQRGIQLYKKNPSAAVIGVSPARSHPSWCFSCAGEVLQPLNGLGALSLRSQDLPPAYEVNGSFYLISPRHLRKGRSFYVGDLQGLFVDDPVEALDIDTEWDWAVAESLGLKKLSES